MRTTLHIATALGLAAILAGQVNRTAPPGFSTTSSPPGKTTRATAVGSYAFTFGAYYDEISQVADGNYKGTAFAINELKAVQRTVLISQRDY